MKTIIAGIDLLDVSSEVIKQASYLAEKCSAKLFLIHIASTDLESYRKIGRQSAEISVEKEAAKLFHQEHKKIQAISSELRDRGVDATALMIEGSISGKISEEAAKLGADIIVIGHHKHGILYKILVGDIGDAIVEKTQCSVLLVPLKE
jgi:nucleotide-binding universal stress UspA family protein